MKISDLTYDDLDEIYLALDWLWNFHDAYSKPEIRELLYKISQILMDEKERDKLLIKESESLNGHDERG